PVSDVAMVNLDAEAALEVFSVRESDARLDGRDGDGFSLPGFPLDLGLGDGPYFLSGGPMVSEDVDWLVVAEDNVLTVLGEDGVQPEGWPWTAPAAGGVINGRVAFGDVDGDGLGEMVVPLTERTVILDHLAQVETVFGAGEAAAGTPSLADFDDDGDMEIVIPRSDGTVHVVHHDGTSAGAAWPYDTGVPGTPSQVALADIGGDARRDLVFMDAAHSVHAVTVVGNVLLNWEMDVPLGSPVVEPMVAKVGPGERAVIVGGVDGRLRVTTVDGPQDGWPRDMGGEIHAPVAVADVDSDGKVEMVVATTEETWVLDMGVSGPFPWEIWPMSGADPRRRGSVGSGPIGEATAAPRTPPAAVAHLGAAPNPFNPVTQLSFELLEAQLVSLTILDARGRQVAVLARGERPAGRHTATWNGRDQRGRPVPAGIYFARLDSEGGQTIRKLALIK
ncbi:T9SS type A sorting domain-containing protein, partial [bacterium]|nr:T9SS type A sorting domain-containing protein [bacterium]